MQDKVVKCLGLVAQYNPLSVAPGALQKALNVLNTRENIFEDRRGHRLYSSFSGAPAQLAAYMNRVLVHEGTSLRYDNGSGTFAAYAGAYSAVSGSRIRSVEAFSNFYFTTSLGVKVLTDVAGTAARSAGVARALDPSYTLTGSSGFLADTYQCAYRALIRRIDANANTITGYPSQRLWVTNAAGGGRNVILTMYLPTSAIAGDIVQFYRTEQVSGTASDTAGDEMGLCYNYKLTSTDVSNGYMSFTDSVTDALRGATLYTSSSQEGIAQANAVPPLCKDLALYKTNYMFFANTQTKQRLNVSLLGTAALGANVTSSITNTSTSLTLSAANSNIAIGWKVVGTGIPANTTVSNIVGTAVTLSNAATATNGTASISFYTNQTITLAGVTYNFGSSEIVSGGGAPQVEVSVSGVAASDIDLTARSMIRVINRYAGNTAVYAYYLTGPDDLPGQMTLEERGVGAAAFTIQGSAAAIGAMFSPELPVSPATTTDCTSSNQVQKNAVYYSKAQQGEHVPLTNFFPVGAANKEILRIVGLRDSAIVIKEDGVFRVTGENPQSFSVVEVDKTVICVAPDSVVLLQNQVYMLSNQGVVAISETGAQVVSREITPLLKPLLQVSNLKDYTAAAAYDSDTSYYLSTITSSTDTEPNQTLIFNTSTKTWVKHTYAFRCALVETLADKLYFAKPDVEKVFIERKSFSDADYADPEESITLVTINGTTVTFTASGFTPDVGWVIQQSNTEIPIKSLTFANGTFTAVMETSAPGDWTAGAATIYPSVGFDAEWQPWTGNMPNFMKQINWAAILGDDSLNDSSATALTFKFRSNFIPEFEEVDIVQSKEGWGSSWGSSPWGGGGDPVGYPTLVPMEMNYCTRLTIGVKHKYARQKLVVAGFAVSGGDPFPGVGT